MKLHVGSFLFLFVITPDLGLAQVPIDPSSAALLNNSASTEDEELDPRFTVKAKAPEPAPAPEVKKKPKVVTTTKIEVKNDQATATPPAPPAPVEPARPSISEQVKVLFMGGRDEEIEEFKKNISPNDRRHNHLELSFAPTYFYNSSASNYSYRSFTVQSPALNTQATLWFSPFFGLQASYMFDLNASVASEGPNRKVPLNYQDIELGARFRNHFGLQRKSMSLVWGLDFFQNDRKVPSDTTDRVSTTTSGLSISVQADIPHSVTYSHIVGMRIRPRAVHDETSDYNIHSGGRNTSHAIGAWVGGDWIFDRHNQFFWKLQHNVEQNRFESAAALPDPVTGQTPNGVSITNSMTLFSIGYRWGK